MRKKFVFSISASILIIIIIVFISTKGKFIGTDDKAISTIGELNKEYRPWFNNIWKPSSKKTETMLFGLQTAIGASFIIYYVRRKIKCSEKSQPIQK